MNKRKNHFFVFILKILILIFCIFLPGHLFASVKPLSLDFHDIFLINSPARYLTESETHLFQKTDRHESSKGQSTQYRYDTLGRKVAQTQANGLIEHYWEYDNAGSITLERMPEGEEVIKNYDNLDRLILVIKDQDRRYLDYDSRGRLISDTNFNNDITTYSYDPAGRLIQQTRAASVIKTVTKLKSPTPPLSDRNLPAMVNKNFQTLIDFNCVDT